MNKSWTTSSHCIGFQYSLWTFFIVLITTETLSVFNIFTWSSPNMQRIRKHTFYLQYTNYNRIVKKYIQWSIKTKKCFYLLFPMVAVLSRMLLKKCLCILWNVKDMMVHCIEANLLYVSAEVLYNIQYKIHVAILIMITIELIIS